MFSVNIAVNAAGELLCPLCAGSNTHINQAEAEPWPTGGRYELIGWCESCFRRFSIVFTARRGVTLVQAVDLHDDLHLEPLGDLLPHIFEGGQT